MLRRKEVCLTLIVLFSGIVASSQAESDLIVDKELEETTVSNLPRSNEPPVIGPDTTVLDSHVFQNKSAKDELTTWSVFDTETNTTCIILKMHADFVVPFQNISKELNMANFSIPQNASSNGSCGEAEGNSTSQYISLSWAFAKEDGILNDNTFTLEFQKNISNTGADYTFLLKSVSLVVYPSPLYFPNISTVSSIGAENYSLAYHPTHANHSFRCNAVQTLQLQSNLTQHPVLVRLSNMQVEAFRSRSDKEFARAVDCPADSVLTSDIVPIAVGCALAALVVVVLIAYLIGRRRARQRGYQSV